MNKHDNNEDPQIRPTLTRLIEWADVACEEMRASLDPDGSFTPSWLAELEAIVADAKKLRIKPGHITTRAEFGFQFGFTSENQFRAAYHDNITRQLHWRWFQKRGDAVKWLKDCGAVMEEEA